MKRYIITLFLVIVALSGCNDFLTEEPKMSQSNELTLATYKGLSDAVAGAYAYMSSTGWYCGNFIVKNEMNTENGMVHIGKDTDTGRAASDYRIVNYNENNTSGMWSTCYVMIAAVNNVIDNLEGKGDPQDLANLEAEALFLRAFCHFELVRTFAYPYHWQGKNGAHDGVPVVLHTEPNAKPKRNTVAEVYDQIIADLTRAEEIIDPSYVRSGTDKTAYASLEVIQAFLSRVYLYKRDYDNAAAYATKVIDSKKYSMWTVEDLTLDDEGRNVFNQDIPSGGEVIFEVYGSKANSYDIIQDGLCVLTDFDGYGDATCPEQLPGIYEDGDIRKTMFKTATDAKGNRYMWTTKYHGKGHATPDVNNTIVFRLSEMYLTRAEAGINGAKGVNAVADLAMVANNRGATPQPATQAGVNEERRKEFVWEAHLWFDLGRTGRAMTRWDQGDGVVTELPADSKYWAMPIPHRERNVNPNLTQNPGF